MTTTENPFDIAHEIALVKEMKEERVAESRNPLDMDEVNISGMLNLWRGNEPVTFLACPPDKYLYLNIARCLVPSMDASGLMLTMETFAIMQRPGDDNPKFKTSDEVTEFMKHNSLQKLWDQGKAKEYNITEHLMLQTFTRNEDGLGCKSEGVMLPYKVNRDRTVTWLEELSTDGAIEIGGWVAEQMDEIFRLRPMKLENMREMIAEASGIPIEEIPENIAFPEYARLHSDMAAFRFMCDRFRENDFIIPAFGYFVDARDPEACKRAQESLDRLGVDNAFVRMVHEEAEKTAASEADNLAAEAEKLTRAEWRRQERDRKKGE